MEMMRRVCGILLAGFMQFPADANAASDPIPAAASTGLIAVAPSCELHIFPTAEIFDASYSEHPDMLVISNAALIAGLGTLVAALIASAQRAGDARNNANNTTKTAALAQLPIYLSPAGQIMALKKYNARATLKLPDDTSIVQESVLPAPFGDTPKDQEQAKIYKQYWSAINNGTPIATASPPTSPACYRELIVTSITVHKDGRNSFKLLSAFVYRTFDKDLSETGLYDGENAVPRPDAFPAFTQDKVPEALSAAQAAFFDNFNAWVARRVKFK